MKKILIATALAGLSATSALGADMAVKAPMYAKAPMAVAYNWSGFYLGANAGIGLNRDLTTNVTPALGWTPSSYLGREGGVGGVQAGYNWQTNLALLGPTVFGLETDIQATGMRDNSFCGVLCTPTSGTFVTESQRLNWFGTARARVGLVTGPVLTYVTGGFAYGGVKTDLATFGGGPLAVGSFSQTRTGYTFGSGVEASLGGNWTGKLEYLYLDLGSQGGAYGSGSGNDASVFNSKIRENIFRAGLNYNLNGNSTYVAPVANWSGFYIGGNAGSALARNKTGFVSANPSVSATESYNLMPNGFLGGVQAGYDWQAAAWVLGVVADIQGSTQNDDKSCMHTCFVSGIQFVDVNQRMSWLGTVRARLGYSVGSTLFYGTGGLAYGGIKNDIVSAQSSTQTAVSFKHNKSGWTAGAGVETPFQLFGLFGRNWTSNTEYLYVDLGNITDTYGANGFPNIFYTVSSHVTEHIFRTSLNYHFNTPVMGKY